jgi:hypothetical protein
MVMHYFDSGKPIKLNNATCIYCGTAIGGEVARTKEHVIARKFVPRGVLDGCWNLIAWACPQCNGMKSLVEEHVAAVTMQPDVFGNYATDDSVLREEASRKGAGSKSRRTGKRVKASREQMEFGGRIHPSVTLKVNAIGPPQLDEEQAWQLARYHVGAFFYMITYDRQLRRGRFWTGVFTPIAMAPKSDWGNARLVTFQKLTNDWEWRVSAVGAEEYFKIAIRRTHDGPPVWAWALEWNHRQRVVGFCGDQARIESLCGQIPRLHLHRVPGDDGEIIGFRLETPLDQDQDNLFVPAGDGQPTDCDKE